MKKKFLALMLAATLFLTGCSGSYGEFGYTWFRQLGYYVEEFIYSEFGWRFEWTYIESWIQEWTREWSTTNDIFSDEVIFINLVAENEVYHLYFSPSDESTWGEDLLGDYTIPETEAFFYDLPYSGYYDLQVHLSGGDAFEFYGIYVEAGDRLAMRMDLGEYRLTHSRGADFVDDYAATTVSYA